MLKISKRLSVIASLVPSGARVCDIGADHGYLSIYLCNEKKAERIIATDISPLPLKNAEKNIKANGLQSDIELRLCDGLSGINPGEVDTVIIAGMGGEVISGILSRSGNIAQNCNTTVILQPTTSPEALRKFLFTSGYSVIEEIPVLENGKLYSVMLVKFTGEVLPFEEYTCYTGILSPKEPDGLLYLKKQQKRLFSCMTALENIVDKEEEYLYYKSCYEGITKYLTEN